MCRNSNNQFRPEPELEGIGTKIWPDPKLFRNAVLTLIIHVFNCQLIVVLQVLMIDHFKQYESIKFAVSFFEVYERTLKQFI